MEIHPELILDELLVLRSQSGDEKALTVLIRRWHPKLLRQANRHLYDSEVSKDVVQESWQAIMRGIGGLHDSSKFGVWALSITSRKAIDWIRKEQVNRRKKTESILAQDQSISDGTDQKELMLNKVSVGLQGLPHDQKLILSMFYLDGHSLHEISSILNLPAGTVKSRLYYAREHLKKIVRK